MLYMKSIDEAYVNEIIVMKVFNTLNLHLLLESANSLQKLHLIYTAKLIFDDIKKK